MPTERSKLAVETDDRDPGRDLSISATASERARHARISIPIALCLTVLAATSVQFALSLRIAVPWILPDELRYAEMAKSLGDGRLPAIRDNVTLGFGLG